MPKESILVPSIFIEVDLPNDVGGRMKKVSELEGDMVLLIDKNSGEHMPRLGMIRTDSADKECYYLGIPGLRNKIDEKRFWYNDLKVLYRGAATYFSANFEVKEQKK